jgi:hypothetical protein
MSTHLIMYKPTNLGVRVEEVSADKLQVEEVQTLAHQHVEELQVFMVTTVHLPGQGDFDAALDAILKGVVHHHGLRVALSRVQNHAIKQIATLHGLLLKQSLPHVRPVLLRLEIYVVLVQDAVGHFAQLEVVGHQVDGLASGA